MGYISDEDKQVIDSIVPYLVEFAQTHDDLAEPDEGTLRILTRFAGTSFSLGRAYERTSEELSWRERVKEALRIIEREGTLPR